MPNLVGIGLSQVPTNSMLGGLAYQDPEHASIKDLDLKNLSQINSEIADTATDIFIYDTSKDSDGGAWRKRTTHTSWYNETLGTATRGSRREFPAVAVLVLSANKLTIYDGDDPDLSMWMDAYQFVNGGSSGNTTNWHGGSGTFSSVAALNGTIVCGATGGCRNLHFINDRMSLFYTPASGNYTQLGGISTRNDSYNSWGPSDSYYAQLVAASTNDVAMTVLPNAPIDDATGLPVPTIAIATDGGVSVIRDGGTVFDVIDSNGARKCYDVSFTKDHKLMHTGDLGGGSSHAAHVFVTNILTADRTEYDNNPDLYRWYSAQLNYPRINGGDTFATRVLDPVDVGGHHYAMADVGVSLIEDGTSSSYSNTDGMVAYITSDYNTGWMHGNIKGAFLSDTDATNATYTTVADDWATAGSWTKQSSISVSSTGSGTSGTLSITGNGTGSNVYFFNGISVEANTDYVVTVTFGAYNANEFYINDTTYSTANKLLDINALSGLTRGGHFNTGSNTFLYIQGYQVSATATTITSLVIQKVSEKDRSVNNKGLQVFGTITKSAVATGAELVAYSGFTGSNYMTYNASNMNFGTGDFSVSVWVIPSTDQSNEFILELDDASADRFYFLTTNTTTKRLYLSWDSDVTGSELIAGKWNHIVVGRRSGYGFVYVNNKWISDGYKPFTANLQGNGNGTISNYSGGVTNDYAWSGSLALLRISGSAPSAEQVSKMYNDEKVLFQENAKCTLYGSSDAVTALAYDEDTELLHVGTSSGRSDFQGLRRINNTTTAVTTAISASDELIAEQ